MRKRVVFDHSEFGIIFKLKCCDIAVKERLTSYELNACGDHDTLKLTARKGFCLDSNESFGELYIGNIRKIECLSADSHYISAEIKRTNIDLSAFAYVFDDRNISIVKQSVFEISVNDYLGNAHMIRTDSLIPILVKIRRHFFLIKVKVYIVRSPERVSSYMLYSRRDKELGERVALIECKSAYINYGIGNIYSLQALAEAEREIIYVRYLCIAKVYISELSHSLKSVSLNRGQCASVLKGYALQVVAAVEHICRDALKLAVFCKGKRGQLEATLKRALRHCGYIRRYAHIGKTAIREGLVSYTCHLRIIRNINARQLPVFRKCESANLKDAIGDIH